MAYYSKYNYAFNNGGLMIIFVFFSFSVLCELILYFNSTTTPSATSSAIVEFVARGFLTTLADDRLEFLANPENVLCVDDSDCVTLVLTFDSNPVRCLHNRCSAGTHMAAGPLCDHNTRSRPVKLIGDRNVYADKCVSIDRSIWNDYGEVQPFVCAGGKLLTVDGKLHCECSGDDVPVYYKSFQPDVPRCVPESYMRVHADHISTEK